MALTELYTIPARIGGAGPIHVIYGSLGAATDETIYSPAADKTAFLIGALVSEGSATNMTFKSGSETIAILELAANQGIWDKINSGVIMAAEEGEDLVANPSVAVSAATFFVIEASSLVFD